MSTASVSPAHPNDGLDDSSSKRMAAMQQLVNQLLGSLNDAHVPYCLLRNRREIPEGLLGWGDVDLMVPETASNERLNRIFAHLNPAQIVEIRKGRISYFFPVEDLFLRVDIFNGDVEWRGVPFADHRDILAHCRDEDGIMVAAPLHQALVVWLSKLLWSNTYPARYERLIEDVAKADPHAFTQCLRYAFTDATANQLAKLALDGRLAESQHMIPRLKRDLWTRGLRRHPAGTIWSFCDQIRNGIHQRLHPTGLKVVVLGPDGAGKTSVCTRLNNAPSRNIPFGYVKYRLLYHRVLPPLSVIESRIRRRPIKRSVNPHNPHANKPHHPVIWLLKFSYYTLDQWLSELLWTRTQLAHTQLLLFDRHLTELSVDSRRYRYTGPRRLARLLARLAPKPDLFLVLDAPPEIMQSRKQDVTFEETMRQRQAYLDLAKRTPNSRIIDSSQPLDRVMMDVRRALADYVSARTRKRFGLDRHVPNTPEHASKPSKTGTQVREVGKL